ncbi:MAG: hypothetical protein IJ668_12585, partial [Selenomonadaceae bacterium]|nr:hypothetical protein [Selenomonadaceae bacterium]
KETGARLLAGRLALHPLRQQNTSAQRLKATASTIEGGEKKRAPAYSRGGSPFTPFVNKILQRNG